MTSAKAGASIMSKKKGKKSIIKTTEPKPVTACTMPATMQPIAVMTQIMPLSPFLLVSPYYNIAMAKRKAALFVLLLLFSTYSARFLPR